MKYEIKICNYISLELLLHYQRRRISSGLFTGLLPGLSAGSRVDIEVMEITDSHV